MGETVQGLCGDPGGAPPAPLQKSQGGCAQDWAYCHCRAPLQSTLLAMDLRVLKEVRHIPINTRDRR